MYFRYNSTELDLVPIIDQIQREMKCCGAIAPDEYTSLKYDGYNEFFTVPDSCCITSTNTPGCGVDAHPSNIFATVSFFQRPHDRVFRPNWG